MFDWLKHWRRDRKTEQQRKELLTTGNRKISSGVLTPGERQRVFRDRPKK